MTIQELLNQVDDLKPNQYTDANKLAWLSKIERTLYVELFSKHEDDPTEEISVDPETGEETVTRGFNDYTEDTDQDTELLVPEPYTDLYLHYICAQIDYWNGEMARYQNSSLMFNTAYQNFVNYWVREHKTLQDGCLVLF